MRFAGTQLSNFMDPTNFDAISNASMEGDTRKRMGANTGRGTAEIGAIQGQMYEDMAPYEAMAIRAQGAQQGAAGMAQGIQGLASGLAGGFGSMASKGLGGTGNTVYGLGGGAGQGELIAPLSTGDNATSLLDSFLRR